MLRSIKAGIFRLLGLLLNSPLGNIFEKILVWVWHKSPFELPGRRRIIEMLIKRNSGKELHSTLLNGVKVIVPPVLEGVTLYLTGHLIDEEEVKTTSLLLKTLKEGDVFFDIGANLGFYTFLAAPLCGKSGQIHAFEPQPLLVQYLSKSVIINNYQKQVYIQPVAVGESQQEQITIFLATDPTLIGIASTLPHQWLNSNNTIQVPIISIDTYVLEQSITKLRAVKIDIEGAELQALLGMKQTLEKIAPDLLIVEILPAKTASFGDICNGSPLEVAPATSKATEILSFLTDFGYKPYRITDEGFIGSEYSVEYLQSINRSVNVAFVPTKLKQIQPELFL